MKRLLAYLFIVLGLGLVFNNFAAASNENKNLRKIPLNLIFCSYKYGDGTIALFKSQHNECPLWRPKNVDVNTWLFRSKYTTTCTNGKKFLYNPNKSCEYFKMSEVKYDGENFYFEKPLKQTQIAKKEPSQTQEVAEKEKKAEIIFSKCSGLSPNYDSNDIWTIDLEKGLVAEHSFKEEGDNKVPERSSSNWAPFNDIPKNKDLLKFIDSKSQFANFVP